jgi:hypothetical protein
MKTQKVFGTDVSGDAGEMAPVHDSQIREQG